MPSTPKPSTTAKTIGKGSAPRQAARQAAKVAESKAKLDALKDRQEAAPAAAPAPSAPLVFTVNGRPVIPVHNRLSGISRATAMKGGTRLSTDALRQLMAEAGIADPDHTAWEFTLPNGVVIAATTDPRPPAAPTGQRKPRATKASRAEDAYVAAGASPDKVERVRLAKAEHKLLQAWVTDGERPPRPATPNLDAVNADHAARGAKKSA